MKKTTVRTSKENSLKLLIDTNVVLDVLLDRKPFSSPAAQLFSGIEAGVISGYLCATTVTTVHYLAAKALGARESVKLIRRLLLLFEIAPVNRAVLSSALGTKFADFEDAVICEAARRVNAQAIITRDARGFRHSPLPVHSPTEILKIMRAGSEPGDSG